MRKVNTNWPLDLYERLRSFATARGVTISAAIRLIVSERLMGEP